MNGKSKGKQRKKCQANKLKNGHILEQPIKCNPATKEKKVKNLEYKSTERIEPKRKMVLHYALFVINHFSQVNTFWMVKIYA